MGESHPPLDALSRLVFETNLDSDRSVRCAAHVVEHRVDEHDHTGHLHPLFEGSPHVVVKRVHVAVGEVLDTHRAAPVDGAREEEQERCPPAVVPQKRQIGQRDENEDGEADHLK